MPQEYAIQPSKVYDLGGHQIDGWEVRVLKAFNGETWTIVATVIDRDFVAVLENYLP